MGKPIKSIPPSAIRRRASRSWTVRPGLRDQLPHPGQPDRGTDEGRPGSDRGLIHALNQWMYETWKFDHDGRMFTTPVINLSIMDRALEELEWAVGRGAKTVLVRPAPVPGFRGTRSMGLPEFDPFWQACVQAGIPVCMHASDSGYARYLDDWEPADEYLPFKPTAFRMVAMGKRPIEDTMAAMVCHGALHRNPDRVRILSVENGASWVPYLLHQFEDVYAKLPSEFAAGSGRGLQARVYVAPFWEDDFKQMADLIGADRVIFGSDWPHPEGLAKPGEPGRRSGGARP